MKSLKATKKKDKIKVVFTNEITLDEALERKKQLRMNIENYRQQIEVSQSMMENAETELNELNLILSEEEVM